MTRPPAHPDDPRHLIEEAYRIDGISVEDCRAIFFDWALGLPVERDATAAAAALLAHHEPPAEHPMTTLLQEALQGAIIHRARKRGRRGRSK